MVGLQYLFLEPNADDPLNKRAFDCYSFCSLELVFEITDTVCLCRRGRRGAEEQSKYVCSERHESYAGIDCGRNVLCKRYVKIDE